MQAETRAQPFATPGTTITPSTPALIAVGQVARSAVVAGGDDAIVAHEDGTDATFHAVRTVRRERGEAHEILVPGWAEAGGGDEVEGGEVGVEGWEGRERVEDAEVGPVD